MRTHTSLCLLLSVLVGCASRSADATDTSRPDEAAAEDFGRRLEAVLEHPEGALDDEDRVVMIATIRHMEDFPLDASLAPLIRPMLAWATQSTSVHIVGCASVLPVESGPPEAAFPARLAMTYYVLELVAQALEHPERPPTSEASQLLALEAAVRAYVNARDRIGHDATLDALATRITDGTLAPFYAEHNGCATTP